jgi:hypothetical protein
MNEQMKRDGIIDAGGTPHMRDSKGHLVPLELVKPQDQLQDEIVRKIIGFARDLSGQVSRFKGHSFEDVNDFLDLLQQQYGEARGKRAGTNGNLTLMTFDGTLKVQVAVADHFDYGPELQIAKSLVDECLNDWAADANENLRAIVTRAFNTDKEGKINRAELLGLKRLEIDDPRWISAMKAIKEAERAVGSKTYMRFYEREDGNAPWRAITIDMAKA